MSINKLVTTSFILATASLGSLPAMAHAQHAKKAPHKAVENAEATTPAAPATLEDLKNAALAFEAADNEFTSHPHGQLSIHYKSILKIRVMNSQRDKNEIAKAVNHALNRHTSKKGSRRKNCDNKHEHIEFAKNEVMRKFNGYLEKSSKGMGAAATEEAPKHQRLRPVMKAARDYMYSMVVVSAKIKDKYNKQCKSRLDCKKVVQSLLEQGHTSETIRQEMQNAGVSNPYVLSKPAYWEKKKNLGVS